MGKLEDIIEEKSENGTIPCARALKIARDFDISPAEVGETLDRMEIRIISCQLGCFP